MKKRYAIYFAPAQGSAWWRFGSHWLGRNESTGGAVEQAAPVRLADGELERITAQPRHYGFHATLKAPFRLRDGVDEQALLERVRRLAHEAHPVPVPALVPVFMDGFVALVPATPNPALVGLAKICVTELDKLRAPMTEAEFARRRPEQLDVRGRELLELYGYPLVLERFRFHMTLTGRIDTALAGQVVAQVAGPIARLNIEEPTVVDRLCVFVEPEPGAHFLRIHDAELRP